MQTSNISSVIHKVQYYETDSMKIVHHSNYIKWMEEARLQYFYDSGFDWKLMENRTGIMIPVLFQSVEYIERIEFAEEIHISCKMNKFNGVKMNFEYIFKSEDGKIKANGITKHGFIDENFNPIILKHLYFDGYEKLYNRSILTY